MLCVSELVFSPGHKSDVETETSVRRVGELFSGPNSTLDPARPEAGSNSTDARTFPSDLVGCKSLIKDSSTEQTLLSAS